MVEKVIVRYPEHWFAPVNPLQGAVEGDARAWFAKLHVVRGAKEERVFEAMSVGRYGGCPFPFAGWQELQTVTRALSLWIFWDDAIEGTTTPPESVGKAIRGELKGFRKGSPYLRGWWEIGRRFRATMSEAWLREQEKRFDRWIDSVSKEAKVVSTSRRTGRQPPVAEYLALKAVIGGALPVTHWIEYAQRQELDPATRAHPARWDVEVLTASIIGVVNDLVGVTKDFAADWPNVVRSFADEQHCRTEEAFGLAVRLHDDLVHSLQDAEERLLKDADGPAARRWLDGIHHLCTGFAGGPASAPRDPGVHRIGKLWVE
ncbi:terpene synthase family protein, partial [Streptomyces sp. NPDC054933]